MLRAGNLDSRTGRERTVHFGKKVPGRYGGTGQGKRSFRLGGLSPAPARTPV